MTRDEGHVVCTGLVYSRDVGAADAACAHLNKRLVLSRNRLIHIRIAYFAYVV